MSDLFKLGQVRFHSIVMKLRRAGLPISSNLKLRASDDMLCYYDIASETISLAMPDRDNNQGRLQMMLLRSLLDCASNEEVIEFLRLIMDWLITHEIAHHCRHQIGYLSANIWQEEQIANYLAIAMSKPNFAYSDQSWCDAFLQRAIQNLSQKQVADSSTIDSYHSLPHSLQTSGLIDNETFDQIAIVKKQTGYLSEVILKNKLIDNLPSDIEERVHNRHQIINRINNAGSYLNIFQYLYYYFGWMHIGLTSTENYSLQEFRHYFLNEDYKYLFNNIMQSQEQTR